jgi:hypothetical protein
MMAKAYRHLQKPPFHKLRFSFFKKTSASLRAGVFQISFVFSPLNRFAFMTPEDLKIPLAEIRQAAAELYRFTEKLTLLKIVHQVAVQTIKSVDLVQKEIRNLSGDKLFAMLETSKSVLFLEDIVDSDTISELESYVLPFAKNLEDEELTRFLSEVTDKIEVKYGAMLEKIHEFNALIKDELE